MSLSFSEELSRIRMNIDGLAEKFSRSDPTKFRYPRIGLGLVIVAIFAVLFYPKIPLSPAFKGGKALEVYFETPVSTTVVQQQLYDLIGKDAEIQTEELKGLAGKTQWVLTKFPTEIEVRESKIVQTLAAATGITPEILSLEGISRTLVAKTRLRVGIEMFIGFLFLLGISVVIYNVKAGFFVMTALAHDIIILLGGMALFRVDLDLPAIAVFATMVGYSINDSIVILHKLRILKLEKSRGLSSYSELSKSTMKALPALMKIYLKVCYVSYANLKHNNPAMKAVRS